MRSYNGQLTSVSASETRRYAGIKDNRPFPESLIQKACLEAQLLAEPQGVYEFFPYNNQLYEVQSTPPLKLTGQSITHHLERCDTVAVLAVTIGSAIETEITHHFASGNYTAGLLLDAAATTAVESLADQVNTLIKSLAAKTGHTPIWRFSPGYGDWDILIQHDLLQTLSATVIGLTVTESQMLMPRKSITAIIGLLPNAADCHTNNSKTTCATCSQKNCIARKEISQ